MPVKDDIEIMIHNTAIVSKKAELAEGVSIGPYTVITDNVRIAAGTKVGVRCFIDGNTMIGENCEIFTGAVIGSRPQDLKFKGEKSFLIIGNNNIIREYCTFNPGTEEGGKTLIGSNNLFMAYSHIAHDCVVGDNCVVANNGTLAGHVKIEDKAVVGGLVAIHQFVTVGTLSIIGGCSKVVQDIPPYSVCDGHPAKIYGLNLVGLKRYGFSKAAIEKLNAAFKMLFNSGLTIKHALERLRKDPGLTQEVAHLVDFINNSQRGITHSCRKARIKTEK